MSNKTFMLQTTKELNDLEYCILKKALQDVIRLYENDIKSEVVLKSCKEGIKVFKIKMERVDLNK